MFSVISNSMQYISSYMQYTLSRNHARYITPKLHSLATRFLLFPLIAAQGNPRRHLSTSNDPPFE